VDCSLAGWGCQVRGAVRCSAVQCRTYVRIYHVVYIPWLQSASREAFDNVGRCAHGLACLDVLLDWGGILCCVAAEAEVEEDAGYFSAVGGVVLDEEGEGGHGFAGGGGDGVYELVAG
jgi:hypothetical protein